MCQIVDKNIVAPIRTLLTFFCIYPNIVDKNIVDILNRYENFEYIQNPNAGHSESGFAHSYHRAEHNTLFTEQELTNRIDYFES